MQTRYSEEFKEQALSKVLQRGDKSIQSIADELNISVFTLKGWLKRTRSHSTTKTMQQRPKDWTRKQRFEALLTSADLEGEALNAVCRGKSACRPHCAHEPSNIGISVRPIRYSANSSSAAETPEPQLVTMGLVKSTPASKKIRRNRSSGNSVKSSGANNLL